MDAGFKLDTKEFREAMATVLRVKRYDASKYLNKVAIQVIVGSKGHPGAIKTTYRANAADIKRLKPEQLMGGAIKLMKTAGLWPRVSRQTINEYIERERARRIASIAYTAGPGWFPAAAQLGFQFSKARFDIQKGFLKSEASKGKARRATPSSMTSIIQNHAPAAGIVGLQGLQEAVNGQAADMRAFAAKEILTRAFKAVKPK